MVSRGLSYADGRLCFLHRGGELGVRELGQDGARLHCIAGPERQGRHPAADLRLDIDLGRPDHAEDGGGVAGPQGEMATGGDARQAARKPGDEPDMLSGPTRHEASGGADAAGHGDQEIGQQEGELGQPVLRHFGKAGTHLVDAHNSVDRRFRREDAADPAHHRWDRLDRPGQADKEELRQGGGDEQDDRRLPALEPGPRRLAEEAGGENERGREQAKIGQLPKVEKP